MLVVPTQNSQDRPEGTLWGPSPEVPPCAGRKPAYKLVTVIFLLKGFFDFIIYIKEYDIKSFFSNLVYQGLFLQVKMLGKLKNKCYVMRF